LAHTALPPRCTALPCRKACSSGSAAVEATHHLDVSDLLRQYGKEPGVLDNRALEQACTAIMACQVGPKSFAAAAVHCVCASSWTP
jgi:hypothetical protein